MFLLSNAKYFKPIAIPLIKEKLLKAEDEKYTSLQMLDLKSPSTITIMSVLLGGLGVDRFMVGDTGMGVLKLLTGGLCGILTIVDWFTIGNKAKDLNLAALMSII